MLAELGVMDWTTQDLVISVLCLRLGWNRMELNGTEPNWTDLVHRYRVTKETLRLGLSPVYINERRSALGDRPSQHLICPGALSWTIELRPKRLPHFGGSFTG